MITVSTYFIGAKAPFHYTWKRLIFKGKKMSLRKKKRPVKSRNFQKGHSPHRFTMLLCSIIGHRDKKSVFTPNLFPESHKFDLHNSCIVYIQKNLSVPPKILLLFGQGGWIFIYIDNFISRWVKYAGKSRKLRLFSALEQKNIVYAQPPGGSMSASV